MRHFPLLPLCVVVFGPARVFAQAQPELLVDALGCEVPISTRYHANPGKDGITFEIPRTLGTRIWIGPLTQHADTPLDSQYRGALKVELHKPGCMSISDRPWVSVQGLHQEADLIGLSDQEVAHVIEHCNATMNPEAVAIAARMAKGCAAVVPTDEAVDALLGKAGLAKVVSLREGTTRPFPVTSWQIFLPERSPNLEAQGVHKGAEVTSICGVPISEVEEGGASLCCSTAVTDHIDAIVVENGNARTITGPAPTQVKTSPNIAGLLRLRAPKIGCGS
jgi:hypothetical protein